MSLMKRANERKPATSGRESEELAGRKRQRAKLTAVLAVVAALAMASALLVPLAAVADDPAQNDTAQAETAPTEQAGGVGQAAANGKADEAAQPAADDQDGPITVGESPKLDGANQLDDQEDDQTQPYTLNLYGYNFGGLYKVYTSARNAQVVIGYPDDVKTYLTFESANALAQIPFTYAQDGFNVENIGLVQEERNTNAGYQYHVIGFVPVSSGDIENMASADEYKNAFTFDSKEGADSFINTKKGVLYGEKPSDDALSELQEKGALAVVWQQGEPRGFRYARISASPAKVKLGNGQAITLTPSFSYLQQGDYSQKPLQVTISLDDNLTFSGGSTPSVSDNDYFKINPGSIAVSEDRKHLTFNIVEISKDYSSYAPLMVQATVDVSNGNQTSDKISLSATNNWGSPASANTSVTIDRSTVKTTLDNKQEKALFFGEENQTVVLRVVHGNAVKGATNTHVRIAFPNLVTVKSAATNSSNKNTIENLTVTTTGGVSTLEYDVTDFASVSSGNSTDIIDLVLDVVQKADNDEEKGNTVCVATENDAQVLVTQNVAIKVTEPYFEVRLYGQQDAWLDMSRGDGGAPSTSCTLRFYGASDPTALAMHAWSFEEDPIKGIYSVDADGSVMVGPVVNNQYTNMQWTLVGFVPISYWSGTIRDQWSPLYGEYYLDDLEACMALIEEKGGVLYGETPTPDQAQSLAQYKSGGSAKVICVWYIQEPPKEVYQKYAYTEADEYVPKVHPAAYTETSSGIQVSIESAPAHSGSGVHPYNVTFVIPENYDEDTITLNTEFNEAAKAAVQGFQPGDKLQYNIKVIDRSGKYGYLKDSGAVGTIDYYQAEHMNYSFIGEGFEGYRIENADEKPGGHSAKSRVTRRGDNNAIRQLAAISEMDLSQTPTDENVGKMLYAIGYGAEIDGDTGKPTRPLAAYATQGGEPDYAKITRELLDDYYLDYLNAVYFAQDAHKKEDRTQPHYKNFADLSAAEYRSIFNGDTGTQVMETNPVLVNAMYYGMYEESILMSESESGIENYKGTYSWMDDWNEATEGNAYESVIYNQYEESAEEMDDGSVEHDLHWYQWVTGTRNGNQMQDTYFGLAYQFKLVKKMKVTKVQKDHKDAQHVLTGVTLRLTKVDENGDQTEVQPLGLPFTGEVNDKGELMFPALLPGRYKLEETKVPDGYNTPQPWYLNVGATGAVTFEPGTTLVSNVETAGKSVFNEFWIENEPGVKLPNTGGPGKQALYYLGLSLVAAAVSVASLSIKRRRSNRE